MIRRRDFLAGAAVAALMIGPASARLHHGSVAPPPAGWQNLKAGAGGLITGMDMHADGTLVCRTDVFGGYYYNRAAPNPGNAGGTGAWQQLITTSSMAAYPSLLNYPGYMGDGLHEIRIAPNNSNIFYMVYLGFVWISTNRGATWTQTAYAQNTALIANGGQQRVYRYKMAVDPNTADVVYLADYINGPSVTLNGTTSGTWNAIAGLASVDANNVMCTAIDPSSSLTSGRHSVVYIAVSGTGLYKSTTGGGSGTYSLVSGTPTQIIELAVNADGIVFCVDNSTGKLWRLAGSTWTDITPSGLSINSFAIDPSNPKHVVACPYGGAPRETADAETATPVWGTAPQTGANSTIMSATDTPMIGTLHNSFWTSGDLSPVIDALDTTKMWLSANQGVWTTTLPLPASPIKSTLISVSAGIEEIVNNCICVPPSNAPLLLGWDIGLLQQPNVNTYLPKQNWYPSNFLNFGAWADYASNNSNFVAAIVDFQGPEVSGYSTDGGVTWTAFAGAVSGGTAAGSIAVATSSEMIWVQANDGQPQHTLNGGSSWSTISGLPVPGWHHAYYNNRCGVAADRVNVGTFYIQNGGTAGGGTNAPGTYVISNSGATVVYHANTIDSLTFDATTGGSPNDGNFNALLRAVPGNAGHLFFASGIVGSGGTQGNPASAWPHTARFWSSHDGGATWVDVSSLSSNNWTVREVWSFGLGAPVSPNTYPAVYVYGFVATGSSPLPSGSSPALWASYDGCVTWTQIAGQHPSGWPDVVKSINGDMSIAKRIYVGYQGSGWRYYQG